MSLLYINYYMTFTEGLHFSAFHYSNGGTAESNIVIYTDNNNKKH